MTKRISGFFILATALLLSACGREEEPVANRFERQKAEIEKKARAIEAQVEKDVSAAEAQIENEGAALANEVGSGNAVNNAATTNIVR